MCLVFVGHVILASDSRSENPRWFDQVTSASPGPHRSRYSFISTLFGRSLNTATAGRHYSFPLTVPSFIPISFSHSFLSQDHVGRSQTACVGQTHPRSFYRTLNASNYPDTIHPYVPKPTLILHDPVPEANVH